MLLKGEWRGLMDTVPYVRKGCCTLGRGGGFDAGTTVLEAERGLRGLEDADCDQVSVLGVV